MAHLFIDHSNTSVTLLRREELIFSRWRSLRSSAYFLKGKTMPGKLRELEWEGKGEEIGHQGELKLQELNYEIAEGIA